jgi:hypothetical protein
LGKYKLCTNYLAMSNVLLRLQFVPLSSLFSFRSFRRTDRDTERDAERDTEEPIMEENALRDENVRILGIIDIDRSTDPCIKRLRQLCKDHGFTIWAEFIADFLSRLHRERKIESLELHQLLILIDTAASM